MSIPQIFDALKSNIITSPNSWQGVSASNVPWSIHEGDARTVLTQLDDNSFNCCVTSPPYYNLRDYGVENQLGLEETITEYVGKLTSVMDEVRKKLKTDGLLFLNIGDTYYSGKGQSQGTDRKSNKRRFGLRPVDKSGGVGIGIQRKSVIGVPWRVAIEMSKTDWVLRSAIIWHRARGLPEAVLDRPRRSYEYVFMFAKDRKYYFNRQPLIEKNIDEDVWTIPPRPKLPDGIDTAPYPDELVQRCIDIGCPEGGAVLDPFAGSGTTLRVAIKNHRPATGIDLNPDFCRYMVTELSKY
ncbi:MAG: site-specific DNA-methyltransferase [Pyrinomonadaceae bacterium]|nr:site-specific DNA-methyltransferase [Pyrinomonadaceae bacterium]